MFGLNISPEDWARAIAEVKARREAEEKSKPKPKKPTGAKCGRCKEYNAYAELDAEGKYSCFQCSKDPFR